MTGRPLLQTLACPVRRSLLLRLADSPASVGDLADYAGVALSLASRRLTGMARLGLLRSKTQDGRKVYSLTVKTVVEPVGGLTSIRLIGPDGTLASLTFARSMK